MESNFILDFGRNDSLYHILSFKERKLLNSSGCDKMKIGKYYPLNLVESIGYKIDSSIDMPIAGRGKGLIVLGSEKTRYLASVFHSTQIFGLMYCNNGEGSSSLPRVSLLNLYGE